MKAGLIGCGAIGREIAYAIDSQIPQLELFLVYDVEKKKADELVNKLKRKPKVGSDIQQVVTETDLTIEAASPKIVGELLTLAEKRGKDLMIMSIGGVLNHLELLNRIKKEGKCKIFFPSGAIAGVDGLNAAREKNIQSISITTSKPPKALLNAPYIIQNKIELENIKKPTLIFEGNCEEAIKAFPRNINVSATLSLAGVGMKKTKVKIIANPNITKNEHKIEVKGEFGEMEVVVRNVPSSINPKTSYLAALSAVATLRKMVSPVKIGT